ncbi:MAG: DUF5658 family protein [Armatimonadota bacterium]
MNKALSRETFMLIVICASDAFLTVILCAAGYAREANPFMAMMLQYGAGVFLAVKLGVMGFLAALVEWYRSYNPVFVKSAMRMGIVAYLGLYIIGVLVFNFL